MSQTPHGQRVSARNIQENNDQPLVYPRMRFDDEARIMDGMVQSFVHWYNNAWYLGVRYIDEFSMIVRDEKFVKRLDNSVVPPHAMKPSQNEGNAPVGGGIATSTRTYTE